VRFGIDLPKKRGNQLSRGRVRSGIFFRCAIDACCRTRREDPRTPSPAGFREKTRGIFYRGQRSAIRFWSAAISARIRHQDVVDEVGSSDRV